jgi:hypothetical protein
MRGNWLGNRGGRFHCERTQTVAGRPWASKQWICCQLSFKGRRRQVWGQGYTELFFADEATALAAGQRPCFECRRQDAIAFAAAWGRAKGTPPPRAPEMDAILHAERLDARRGKRLHPMQVGGLPDGTMIARAGVAWLVTAGTVRPWSFSGYGPADVPPDGVADVLTPPSIVDALRAGYRPTEMRQAYTFPGTGENALTSPSWPAGSLPALPVHPA